MGSRFSSILPINVINVAVSADRAMLDNQTGIKLEFLRLAPHEAHGKTFEGKKKNKTVEIQRGIWLCQKIFLMPPQTLSRDPRHALPCEALEGIFNKDAGPRPELSLDGKQLPLLMGVFGKEEPR